MTVDEMIADVCGPLSYNNTDTSHIARVVRWLNQAQKDMADYDWPELITANASFTTTSSETYDLSNASYAGSTFQRVVERSVRIDDRNLAFRTEQWFDEVDPKRTLSGYAQYCALSSRTDFRIFPAESGKTCYYDWVKIPATLASGGAESSCSFYPDRHDYIVSGAIWRGLRFIGDTDAERKEVIWRDMIKLKFRKSGMTRPSRHFIRPIKF